MKLPNSTIRSLLHILELADFPTDGIVGSISSELKRLREGEDAGIRALATSLLSKLGGSMEALKVVDPIANLVSLGPPPGQNNFYLLDPVFFATNTVWAEHKERSLAKLYMSLHSDENKRMIEQQRESVYVPARLQNTFPLHTYEDELLDSASHLTAASASAELALIGVDGKDAEEQIAEILLDTVRMCRLVEASRSPRPRQITPAQTVDGCSVPPPM